MIVRMRVLKYDIVRLLYSLSSIQSAPMYAVVKTGGKQYKVRAGETIKVEQIPAPVGSEVTLSPLLAVGESKSIYFGTVPHAQIRATVVAQGRHPKIKIFKLRRRKHYQKRAGHRQNYTELRIDTIYNEMASTVE